MHDELPRSQDAEQSILGAVMLNSSLFAKCSHLQPEDFWWREHRLLWSVVQGLITKRQSIDPVIVAEAAERQGWVEDIGGLPYIHRLVEACSFTSDVIGLADIVIGHARARAVRQIALDVIEAVRGDWNEAANRGIRELMSLITSGQSHSTTLRESMLDAIDMLEELAQRDGVVGVPTGIAQLDAKTGGWHKSDLIVIAARPAMGKTAFLINSAIRAGVPVGFISSEQPREQVALRVLAAQGRIDMRRLRTGDCTEEDYARLSSTVAALRDAQMWINDKPGISIAELQGQAREWKQEHDIQALYVDYIQRIKATDQRRSMPEQLGEVVMGLKELARELAIPVIALAQVNRGVEARNDRRPTMGDIKGSGDIEQEADIVMTLYRDEVYDEDSPGKGIAELLLAKNRHGETGTVLMTWQGEYVRFGDMVSQSAMDGYLSAFAEAPL